jgi:hypothetical protein
MSNTSSSGRTRWIFPNANLAVARTTRIRVAAPLPEDYADRNCRRLALRASLRLSVLTRVNQSL